MRYTTVIKTLSMKHIILAFAFFLSLPSLALAQAPVPQEQQDELSQIIDEVEAAVLNQDADGLSSLLAPGIDAVVAEELNFALTTERDVLSFIIANLDFTTIDEAHVRANGNYSIRVESPNGNWNKSGLGVYFVFEEADGSYLISDTNLNKAVSSINIGAFFEDYGSLIGGVLIFMLVGTAFWLWMLVDLIQRDVPNKALWAIIMIFAGVLGSIIYFFAVRMPHIKGKPTS